LQRHDINKKQLNVELLKPKTMKKKYLIMVATAIFATISINLQAQEDLVGSGDRSVTTDYYPNPTSDGITVVYDSFHTINQVRLNNLFGQTIKVWRNPNNPLYIPTNSIQGGIYMLQIYTEDQIISRKIVINSAL